MKTKLPLLIVSLLLLITASCSSDDKPGDLALFAVPVVKSLQSIRDGVTVTAARATASEGKIYVTEDYLFYTAKEEGVHIFDNTNPAAPQNIAFIAVEGVHDIAVKGNYLFADNFVDLLVFDISNINNITLVNTIESQIEFYPTIPEGVEYVDYTNNAGTDEVIVGYTTKMKPRPTYSMEDIFTVDDNMGGNAGGGAAEAATGIGGSYAKFQINQNALYTIDSYELNVFNISSPEQAYFDKSVYMMQWFGGGVFETLFRQGGYLFVGSTTGMYVVDANDAFNPVFISGFSHATACDPVVVSGNTAYITVRGGSTCGAIEDEVTVIDITDINNPTLLSSYLIDQPRGLGIRNNVLYVCTGAGLKVFDASNTAALVLQHSYSDNVTDVIPLPGQLITVGPNNIKQYRYGPGNTLEYLSVVNF